MQRVQICILVLLMAPARGTPSQTPSPRQDGCGVDCASFFSQGGFLHCLEEAFPSNTNLVLPEHAGYDVARTLSSIRVSPKPAAVVYARNTSDVVLAVQCGFRWDVRVTVANGRHSYQGLAIVDGYLAIDTSNLTKLEVIRDPTLFALVGPGITNTLFATLLHRKAPKDVFGVIGSCPSVGFGGYALGGGMSPTSRSHGLACDNVLSLEMVLYNGTVIVANATHHSDVFWASCGGGGGLGVVTEFVVKLHRLPSSVFTHFMVDTRAKDVPGKIDFQLKIQKWWAGKDGRLAGGQAGKHFGPGISSGVDGIFWGTAEEAKQAMYDAGLLDNADQNITDCPQCGEFTSYYDAFLLESCALWVYSTGLFSWLFPGRTRSDCHHMDFLHGEFAHMASMPGSPISIGASNLWQNWNMVTCRLMDPLSRETWDALWGKPKPECDKILENVTHFKELLARGDALASRCYVLKSPLASPSANHLLGGAVADRHPKDTAYYYRERYSPICFNAFLPAHWLGRNGLWLDNVTDPQGLVINPQRIADALWQEIKDRLDGVYSLLGREEASVSYINYQVPPLANWQKAYFGDNAERLAAVKQSYDPLGVFSKPLIVDGVLLTKSTSRGLRGR